MPRDRIVGVLLALLMAVGGAGIASADGGDDLSTATVSSPDATSAASDLDALIAADPNDGGGYDRKLFPHWIDSDGDGCDSRQEVLIAEALGDVVRSADAACPVLSGDWVSSYDGLSISDPGQLDIDHMVPLKEAWRSGADQWTTEQRRAYANDLDELAALTAVTATTNRSKGDKDPARWRPPDVASWCGYADAWITVKVKYELTADDAELDALREMLAGC